MTHGVFILESLWYNNPKASKWELRSPASIGEMEENGARIRGRKLRWLHERKIYAEDLGGLAGCFDLLFFMGKCVSLY